MYSLGILVVVVLSTQILTPFLLRRLKTDVEFSLPPKKEVLVYAPLTSVQQKYYTSLLDKTILDLVREGRERGGGGGGRVAGSLGLHISMYE